VKKAEPVTLSGRHVRLEPMHADHEPDLRQAAADGELWRLRITSVPEPDQTAMYIATALMGQQDGNMLPFVVRELSTHAVIGSTRYHDILFDASRVEVGYTWYGVSWQRTYVNTECKLLLLTHAFETLSCIAVEFRTHFLNFASRAAIERIGAKQDGILRNHQLMADGSRRDTVVFSILDGEWPTVKRNLQWLLEKC
jgi:RimJ/RimL family protein N-acetyltransferase